MNKIFGFLLMSCCLAGFASCDDDTENPYAQSSPITIVSSSLSFDARADRGVARFSAPGAVTARTTASWCTAAVEGDSVVVTVEQNTTISGRSAQLLLSYGGSTEALSIIQRGVVVQLEHSGIAVETDEASEVKYSLVSNVDLVITETPDWATATLADDSITVSVMPNTTGAPRVGYVRVASGAFEDSLRIIQADFDNDIAGTYRLHYKMANGRDRSANVTVSEDGFSFMTLNIPMTYDPYTAKFTLRAGQYVGRSEGGNYVFMMFGTGADEDGQTYWTGYQDSFTISAPIEVADDGSLEATFFGSLGGYEVSRLMFREFSFGADAANPDKWSDSEKQSGLPDLNENRDTGTNMMDLYSPYLTREAPASAAQAQ